MDAPWPLVALAACLALAGCKADPNVPYLERELRLQEDEIFRLRDQVEEYRQAFEGCQLENEQLRAALLAAEQERPAATPAGMVPTGTTSAGTTPAAAPRVGPPSRSAPVEVRPLGPVAPIDARPGAVHLPPPSPNDLGPPGVAPPGAETIPTPQAVGPEGGGSAGPELRPPGTPASAVSYPASTALADSRQVDRIALRTEETAGFDADGQPGDEGIEVVLDALDAQGRAIAAPAEVAVVVLDPALEGQAARVARWDIAAEQLARSFVPRGSGSTMRLKLTWPGAPPQHGQLHLFVRYTTADGRPLKVDQPIRVAMPGERLSRWAPALPSPPSATGPSPAVSMADRRAAPWRAGQTSPAATPTTSPPTAPLARPTWSPNRP